MNPILILLYRNLFTSVNKLLAIWIIVFPIFLLYTAGFSYSAIVEEQAIAVGNLSVDYLAFLATGIIGFNIMNISTIAGSITWKDRRSGMLAQLFVMPFTRMQYLLGNLLTLIMMGFVSAIFIVICSLPIIVGETRFSLMSIPYLIFAIATGSVFFGSITSILSVKLKTSEGFDTMINGIFLFFSFASSAFYPLEEVPEVLRIIFYINPLTHVVDIIRDSMFFQFDSMTGFGVLYMTVLTVLSIVVASHLILKMKDKQISTQI